MFSTRQLQSGFLSLVLVYTLLFNMILPAKAQSDIVLSSRIGGGSSVFVTRTSRKAKKSNYAAKRRSKIKRTTKQRRVSRRTIVRQSRTVAKKNRVRRSIKKVTPTELKEVKLEEVARKSPEAAAKVLAGAGEYYVDRDEFEKAVGYLEQAVELDPNNKDAKHALSETYTTLADETGDKAEEFAALAAKALAENRQADYSKYSTQETFAIQKVERDLIRAIELNDQNSSAYASLGQYYDDREDDAKAKINYEKAIAIDPSLSNVKAPLGIIYYQEGEIAKAEELISAALSGGEDTAEIQSFLGLIRYKQNRNDEAKIALEKSISMDDDNAEAHYYLGATLARLGFEDKAILEYLKTVRIDPNFVNAWFDLGVAYYNRELYEKAIEAYTNAIKLNENQTDEQKRIYAESHANLAEAYRQTGRFDLAIAKYRNAVDLLNDPELYSLYGFALIQQERWIDGIKSLTKVTEMTGDAISYANLGWAHYQESQDHMTWNRKAKQKASLMMAKSALETAIAKDSNLAAGYLNLGYTLNDLGEYKQAVVVLEKANSLQTDWVFAINELAEAYQKSGDTDKAIKFYERAIKLNDKFAFAYYGLGETYVQKGKMKEANKILVKLRALDTNLAKKLERKMKQQVFL